MRISDWSSDVCSSDLATSDEPVVAVVRVVQGFGGGDHVVQILGERDTRVLEYLGIPVGDPVVDVEGQGIDPAVRLRDRRSVVQGKRVSVRVDLGYSRLIKKKQMKYMTETIHYT